MRERQSAFLAGQLAERIEQEQPGRIHCIKLVTTRFKTTTTIVYNRQRVNAPVNVREDDSDDSDEEGDGAEHGSGPPAQNVAAPKPAAAAKTAAAGAAHAVKQRGGNGAVVGSSGGWQQPRKPARQTPQPQPKQGKQPADRNAISARGSAAMEQGQLSALANSINQISKEVCPGSTFPVKRQLPIDGKQVEVQLVPTCLAAEMLRQHPNLIGQRLKHCFLTHDGAAARELIVPTEPKQVSAFASSLAPKLQSQEAGEDEDMGFAQFD